jgi:hypothetical protein
LGVMVDTRTWITLSHFSVMGIVSRITTKVLSDTFLLF